MAHISPAVSGGPIHVGPIGPLSNGWILGLYIGGATVYLTQEDTDNLARDLMQFVSPEVGNPLDPNLHRAITKP